MGSEIAQQQIDEVLEIYKPEQRILVSAGLDYPSAKGIFRVGPTSYVITPFKHATDIEIQLCLNQLVYVSVSEIMRLNLVPELEGLYFKELQEEGMVITQSQKRFRKPIRTDKEITGELTYRNSKKYNSIVLARADFQFEDRNCLGSLEMALIKPHEGETKK